MPESSSSHDRQILFAALAIQAQVLDHDQLALAHRQWSEAACESSFAEHLAEHGWLSAEDRIRVERLLEESLARCAGDVRAARAELTDVTLVGMPPRLRESVTTATDPNSSGNATQTASNSSHATAVHHARIGSPVTFPIVPGYEIIDILGRGGMGRVYKARQTALNRVVALKMILTGPDPDAETLARFANEAEAIARLQHPNIVQIYEVGEVAGQPFIALECVEGRSLDRKLDGKPLPPRQAAEIVNTLADAVHYAHQRGVIHRDLKPANVLLQNDDPEMANDERPRVHAPSTIPHSSLVIPKITDFGLARRLESRADLTRTGAIMGTPSYMAPEQARGDKDIGPAADIHALGAMLYEMLTGRPPFHGDSPWDVVQSVIRDEAMPPRKLRAVPRDLDTICLRCLQKDPGRRYVSARDLADDLRRYLNDEPILARPIGVLERGWKWVRRSPVRATLAFGVLALVLVAGIAGLWYWDAYVRVKIAYFNNAIERRGEWQGVGPVSSGAVVRRFYTLRFVSRGGRLEKIDIINGRRQLTSRQPVEIYLARSDEEEETQPCSFEFRRNEQGAVTECAARNRTGQVVWTLHYTTAEMAHFTDKRGFPRPRAGSGATYLRIDWSAEGFPREIHYLDRNGKPRPDQEGVFGTRSEFDELGQEISRSYLGARGQAITTRRGFARYTQTYDRHGNVSDIAYWTAEGRPALHKDGFARVKSHYDDDGSRIQEDYFDRDGKPARNKDGVARMIIKHDDHGNRREFAYFGETGQPVLHRNGFHRMHVAHDERGQAVEESYFGLDGQLTVHRHGFARLTRAYDERGFFSAESYFDRSGKLTPGVNGFASQGVAHDDRGNRIAESYFGADGQPALHKDGYARWSATYDDHDNLVAEAFFGTDGKPAWHRDGYSRTTSDYDDRGNIVEQSYCDDTGKLAAEKDGVARMTRGYDDNGNQSEEAYWGVDGMPALHRDGYARFTARYNELGRRIEEAYFDARSKPALAKEGYARVVWKLNDRGQKTEEAFFGVDGKPAYHVDGYARATAAHDANDNLTEEAYWDAAGSLTPHKDGYARRTLTYD
ncbi:MAG: serine/threonine protein kinase [Planctomycetes bacterium]|nr:serine/threonine protein kinase [Planctomycetota bacterium]